MHTVGGGNTLVRKIPFSLIGGVYSLIRGLLMGDPFHRRKQSELRKPVILGKAIGLFVCVLHNPPEPAMYCLLAKGQAGYAFFFQPQEPGGFS